MTPGQLMAATGCRREAADTFAGPLTRSIASRGITNVPEYVAQLAYESTLFARMEEDMNYSSPERIVTVFRRFDLDRDHVADQEEILAALEYVHRPEALANLVYADRMGNGDEASGDGWRYRGRGLIQLTGRGNYRRYGLEDEPDSLTDPETASDTAAAYWVFDGCNGKTDVAEITRRVNGGLNGLQDRERLTERARRWL